MTSADHALAEPSTAANAALAGRDARHRRWAWPTGVFRPHRLIPLGRALRVVVVLLLVSGFAAPMACGDDGDDAPDYDAFYTPPDPLPPSNPGDLIRAEPSPLRLLLSGLPKELRPLGTRIMFRSTSSRGKPNVVTATYLEPLVPWEGDGPRPLLVFTPGTQGMGPQCAPSREINHFLSVDHVQGLDLGFSQEAPLAARYTKHGVAVVITDYEGLGTPGVHTYMNRLAEGQAVLDAARAALHLPETSLSPNSPVAVTGYSEGGGAAASAAELQPTYAPELHWVGAQAGAPPANPIDEFASFDGGFLAGGIGYLLNGLIAAYPEATDAIRSMLTDRGLNMLDRTKHQCFWRTSIDFMFRHAQPWFNRDLLELLSEDPLKGLFEAQRIGRLKPKAPVEIDSNRWDPVVPWTGARQLAVDWCAQGADVDFRTNEQPPFLNKTGLNHYLAGAVDIWPGMVWVMDRFKGLPTTPNCDSL
jgi:hypothetical protein